VRLLFVGDVVGKPGRQILTQVLRGLRIRENLDLVVVNAENAAGGSGITPNIYRELIATGVDCITLGDHAFRRREIFSIINGEARIVRPANYPEESPGRPYTIITARNNVPVAICCLLGRVFMPPVDCPFHAIDNILKKLPDNVVSIVVDFHAEATSDMQAMARHLDGRVTAVLGTHTHVPTADETILPGGTAFQCDVGMTGPHLSILGRKIERVLETTRTFRPTNFDVATEDNRLNGTIVEFNQETGLAAKIRRICIDSAEAKELELIGKGK